jgi:hypothetical protein
MTKTRIAAVCATLLLAACGGASAPSPANRSEAARSGNEALSGANAASPAPPTQSASARAGIVVPATSELAAAMHGISDPQLAAQVAPDGNYDAAECVVHLGQAGPVPAGQRPVLDRASAAWRASLVHELGEAGAAQMIGSSVSMLESTPPALRMAAIAWCVDHVPAPTS